MLHGERAAFDQLVIRYHELAYGLPNSGFYLVPGKDRLSRAALRFEEWLLAV